MQRGSRLILDPLPFSAVVRVRLCYLRLWIATSWYETHPWDSTTASATYLGFIHLLFVTIKLLSITSCDYLITTKVVNLGRFVNLNQI